MERVEEPFQFATNVATRNAFYSKNVDSAAVRAAVRAVDKMSALFDNQNGSGRPN